MYVMISYVLYLLYNIIRITVKSQFKPILTFCWNLLHSNIVKCAGKYDSPSHYGERIISSDLHEGRLSTDNGSHLSNALYQVDTYKLVDNVL
jgi:hypothetical protein